MFQIHRDGKECQIKEYHKEKKQTGHQQLTFSELKQEKNKMEMASWGGKERENLHRRESWKGTFCVF